MGPVDKLAVLLTRFVKPRLAAHGFAKRGQTFYLFDHGNWGLINFQRGRSAAPGATEFTVNLGIASARLSRRRDAEWRTWRPAEYECDWRMRLGHLMAPARDKWWTITASTNLDELAGELLDPIETLAVPEIRRFISDEALRDLWLSGRSPGLTNAQRLSRLAILLRALGPAELLPTITAEAEEANSDAARRIEANEIASVLLNAGFTSVEGSTDQFVAPSDWPQRLSEMDQRG